MSSGPDDVAVGVPEPTAAEAAVNRVRYLLEDHAQAFAAATFVVLALAAGICVARWVKWR